MVGSFLNVVIHRLPRMMEREWQVQCAELRGEVAEQSAPFNLVVPRSACPACGHAIAWFENIPLLSFALVRGKCSACGAAISARYPLVELATGLLTFAAAWQFGFTWQAGAAFVLIWALIALAFIDLDTQYLPDGITLPLLWLGLLVNIGGLFAPLGEAVIGAMAGYLSLWLVYHLFRLLTGKEGMGFGDFKLLAALGAWFGWTLLPLIILCSSLVGAVIGIFMIVLGGHDRARPIPFGPYLVLAGLIALFWGQVLLKLYLGG
ncbi:MAG: A24 family peptidase [Gallionellaceae bacterium]|nr:A24 family peptidase [Gallionellaceae bacterium]